MRRRYVRRDVADDEEPEDEPWFRPMAPAKSRMALSLLATVAITAVVWLVVSGLARHPDANAVQVTQIYAEGVFWMAVVIAGMIALYIGIYSDR